MRPSPPPATAPEQAQQRLQQLRERSRKLSEERKKNAAKTSAEAQKQHILKQNCSAARHNLEQLQQRPRLRVSDGKGGMRYMLPAEREQRMRQYRKDVEKYCR